MKIVRRIGMMVLLLGASGFSTDKDAQASSAVSAVDSLASDLVRQLSTSAPQGQKLSVAVGDITDLDDCSSAFGRLIGDQVATMLVTSGRFDVIERQHLEAVLAELHLQGSDLTDPKTAQQVGQFLGVKGLVVGMVSVLGTDARVNLRIVDTESARALGAASGTIDIDATLSAMLQRRVGKCATAGLGDPSQSSSESEEGVSGPGQRRVLFSDGETPQPTGPHTVLEEDFSSVTPGGAPTGWIGTGDYAVKMDGRESVLSPIKERPAGTFTIPLLESIDGDFSAIVTLRVTNSSTGGIRLDLSGLSARVTHAQCNLIAARINDSETARTQNGYCSGSTFNLELQRRGDVSKFLLNGNELSLYRQTPSVSSDSMVLGIGDFKRGGISVVRIVVSKP